MKLVKTLILIILVSGLVVFFQNCSPQQNTGLLGTLESPSTIADKVVTDAPFAYDLVVDTISYNSCVGEYLNESGLHGLKIGANEGFVDSLGTGAVKAGLKLRSDFLEYVGTNVKPKYPSTVITPAQIKNVLANSSLNKDVRVQFAVRKIADLSVIQDIISPGSQTVPFSLPRDGLVIHSPLTDDPVITNLTKNVQFAAGGTVLSEGPRLYNLQSESSPSPIQASFGFSNITDETFPLENAGTDNMGIAERYAETVRNKFNLTSSEKYILAITYGTLDAVGSETSGVDDGLSTPKRADDSDTSKAYGRSFALQFGLPTSPVAAGWKNVALKSVTESNLSDASPASGSRWDCRSYLIMKQTHWNNTKLSEPSCAPLMSSDLSDPVRAAQIKNLRRHYLETDWNIGLFYEADQLYIPAARGDHAICLVPKPSRAECYLPTQDAVIAGTDVGINYNPGTECYLSNRFGTSYSNSIETVRAGGRCAQFASICVRTSTNF
ncbi:MAG: hypothetical protein A2622_05675 [Bdellovibrionales bacterium RIFCSPHIGHO2_01_FULL_40_29]|nr:MAG: hypothetical protein A2622_05675 [Bdellovibrionales bacterium RIFCSPHIGHO2_01_FULL_40_29]OFZ33115.1 MAG: hypothetical protein A3D17_13195 [Bdellovibrionales bacterium RIFCSPHIGHO2_02_FULL_40_15]